MTKKAMHFHELAQDALRRAYYAESAPDAEECVLIAISFDELAVAEGARALQANRASKIAKPRWTAAFCGKGLRPIWLGRLFARLPRVPSEPPPGCPDNSAPIG